MGGRKLDSLYERQWGREKKKSTQGWTGRGEDFKFKFDRRAYRGGGRVRKGWENIGEGKTEGFWWALVGGKKKKSGCTGGGHKEGRRHFMWGGTRKGKDNKKIFGLKGGVGGEA